MVLNLSCEVRTEKILLRYDECRQLGSQIHTLGHSLAVFCRGFSGCIEHPVETCEWAFQSSTEMNQWYERTRSTEYSTESLERSSNHVELQSCIVLDTRIVRMSADDIGHSWFWRAHTASSSPSTFPGVPECRGTHWNLIIWPAFKAFAMWWWMVHTRETFWSRVTFTFPHFEVRGYFE